ncbi:Chloramphenicol phosphotransferase family protein [Kribbella flavida DSM 17836]|uniref:Chloramphenicol phosphotransferase family protein n=1 Tax=Kribbella flavida (strain DSM 17836 / JCM 10339 / NBRC 14399) TaxID=479435 RepID=D2PXC3_KRIFD|nr:Chloramphenicol phosphotransferase family protein [Kribbella flavida DSM 17836]
MLLLNGPSSSGKGSIGRALLPLLPDPWFLVPVDVISGLRSTVHTRQLTKDEIAEMLTRTRRGYHRAVAALASQGNDVIMDYPLSEPWRLTDLLEVLTGYDVTLVEVRCSEAELERRERARQDRPLGLARSQSVFEHKDRDLVVDTTNQTPEACAQIIAESLEQLDTPKAFDRLRAAAS